jgi:hypothetical protein
MIANNPTYVYVIYECMHIQKDMHGIDTKIISTFPSLTMDEASKVLLVLKVLICKQC